MNLRWWAQRAALVTLSGAAALGGVELYLRMFPPALLSRIDNVHRILQPHPLLGYAMKPNIQTRVLSEDGVSEYTLRTNELGLRGEPYKGKQGRKNILGLGDSYLFGDGVHDHQTVMAHLQKLLDERYPGQYRAINAGVQGYATNQEVIYYLAYGDTLFEPDIVLLFFYINDVTWYTSNPPQTYEGVAVPGGLTRLYEEYAQANDAETGSRWKTLELFRLAAKLRRSAHPSALTTVEKTADLPAELRFYNRQWSDGREAIEATFLQALTTMKSRAEARGARAMFVYVPSAQDIVDGEARRRIYGSYSYPTASWDWDLAARTLELSMAPIGVPFINLVPGFRHFRESAGKEVFIGKEGHFSDEGCKLAAEIVFSKLAPIFDGVDFQPAEGEAFAPVRAAAGISRAQFTRKRAIPDIESDVSHGHGLFRRLLSIRGPAPYRTLFRTADGDVPKFISFHVHPLSSPFDIELHVDRVKMGRSRVSADVGGWRTIAIPIRPADSPTPEIELRILPQEGEVDVSPPQGIHPPSARRPPIILVTVDSLRADRLPMYGYSDGAAPNLEKFAADAVTYEDVTTAAPWSPMSHETILSGADPYSRLAGGADTQGGAGTSSQQMTTGLDAIGYVTIAFSAGTQAIPEWLASFQSFVTPGGSTADIQNDALLTQTAAFIRAKKDNAFFLLYHVTYLAAGEGRLSEIAAGMNSTPTRVYDRALSRVDSGIGGLMAVLKSEGLYDSALIIIAGTYGADMGEREIARSGDSFRRNFYQEVMRVPLLIKYPGAMASNMPPRYLEPAGLVDILPTVSEILNIDQPRMTDGEPLFRRTPKPATAGNVSRIFLMKGIPTGPEGGAWGAMRLGRYKMIIKQDADFRKGFRPDNSEIYDLALDPQEKHDLSRELAERDTATANALWNSFWSTGKQHALRFTREREASR